MSGENTASLSRERESWAGAVRGRILQKAAIVVRRSGDKIPYTTVGGRFDDNFAARPYWWCNSFWTGLQWLLYKETGEELYKNLAERLELRMDESLHGFDGLHHDVGFMWLLSAVANYRLTGGEASKRRGLIAASHLAGRFNPKAHFLTAWNTTERQGWSIIDTMMNLPLLYWATEETGYTRFAQVASLHADKTMHHAVRPDGSVSHIIEYDLETGAALRTYAGQGYAEGSSWTRGQAWALYGFTLACRHTGNAAYLATAKRVADYFLSCCAECGYIPPIDFRAPKEPLWVDTTAAAIAASGLLDLGRLLEPSEGEVYLEGAYKLLRAVEEAHADWGEDCDAILRMGSEAYHDPAGKHMDIIYGDYFFAEAVFKLAGAEPSMW